MARLKKDERVCPFCAETIKAAATKCRFCQSELPPERKPVVAPDPTPVVEPDEPTVVEPGGTSREGSEWGSETTRPEPQAPRDVRAFLQERLTHLLAGFELLAAAGVGECWWQAEQGAPSIDDDARTQVLVSAADLTQRTLSYDYKSLDQDMETASAKMSPTFRKEYRSTMNQVRANTEKNKIVLEASAVASAIIDVSTTKAKVLVFANQTTSVGAGKDKKQQLLRNSLVVTLERDGGDWVIDQLTALG
jgi:Mce-associated membrane protein